MPGVGALWDLAEPAPALLSAFRALEKPAFTRLPGKPSLPSLRPVAPSALFDAVSKKD